MINAPKIGDIIKSCDLGDSCGSIIISAANIDDVFNKICSKGIERVAVYPYEMNLIVMWYLANSGDKDPQKPEIVREGKIKRFLGVDIQEIDTH